LSYCKFLVIAIGVGVKCSKQTSDISGYRYIDIICKWRTYRQGRERCGRRQGCQGRRQQGYERKGGQTLQAAPSGSPSESPSRQPSFWWRHVLVDGEETVKEDVPLERRLEIIEGMKDRGTKSAATFSFMYDLISQKSCDALALVKYMEALALAMQDEANIPVRTANYAEGSHEAWNEFDGRTKNQCNKKLYVNDLVRLIGRKEK